MWLDHVAIVEGQWLHMASFRILLLRDFDFDFETCLFHSVQ